MSDISALNELLERLWLPYERGVADPGFARDSRDEFDEILEDFFREKQIPEMDRPKINNAVHRLLKARLAAQD